MSKSDEKKPCPTVAGFKPPPIPDLEGISRSQIAEDPKAQVEWLLQQIDDSLKCMAGKRTHFQRAAGYIRVGILILSGTVTVLLGLWTPDSEDTLRNVAFVIGAIVTTLSSLDFYFNYRGLWVEHEEAEWRLHRLRDRLSFYVSGVGAGEIDPQVLIEIHEAYQWIWDNLSTRWLSLRRTESNK